jgi:thiamine-phosphate pyrophosphorylase
MSEIPTSCQIYLITPSQITDIQAFCDELGDALIYWPVAALQIRLKNTPQHLVEPYSVAIRDLCFAQDVAVLMNDDVFLAKKLGLDGAHIGQSDMSYKEARQILGPSRMIGVTCHNSRHLAMEASEAGADYVAFGAFFDTQTKQTPYRADPEILSIWQETMQTPSVAIGGITDKNAGLLARAGADFVAISSFVFAHDKGVKKALEAISLALKS